MDLDLLEPNRERLQRNLDNLSRFISDGEGWQRCSFSDVYRESRPWVMERMKTAGLDVHIDSAGNIIGILTGAKSDKAALATGSHTDTVPQGGRFDGVVGLLGAIEAVHQLQETNTHLDHDLVVIDFIAEETNEFSIGCMGSQALIGAFPIEYFNAKSASGSRFTDVLQQFGLTEDGLLNARWKGPKIKAFVEMHVEQGPVLERNHEDIGVVTAISGIEMLQAKFKGQSNHAGTTPMTERKDALAAAAAAVLAIEQMGCSGDSTVATVARVDADSGASNVIACEAQIWAELRSTSSGWIETAKHNLIKQIQDGANQRGVEVDMSWLTDEPPAQSSPAVHDLVANTTQSLGYSWRAMPSGAGHDAGFMSKLAPMGMIFVPSKAGLSHCPEEWTDLDAIAKGVHVLTASLLALDRSSA